MRRAVGRSPRTLLLGLAGAVFILLVLAQLILPRIAASTISSRIGRYGKVRSVHVSAFPAVELLWGHVDSVQASAGTLTLTPTQAASLLHEAGGVQRMDVHATAVQLGSLHLTGATLSKHGSSLAAAATASEADVRAALPQGFEVKLLHSEAGAVEVQSSGGLFGVGATIDAVAGAREGKLVARPRGFLLEAFQLTLFSDPRIHVEGVGAGVVSGGYRLTMTASLP